VVDNSRAGFFTSQVCCRPPFHAVASCQSNATPDFHPDEFYKAYTSTEESLACHRGRGPAGLYGAETSDCDTPFSLVNATFDWIAENIRDKVDFVIWTGDSARHDSDEELPRSEYDVIYTNTYIADKFAETFGNGNSAGTPEDMSIPVVPTFGNNDFLPHNIFSPGPNRWLYSYANVWRKFIPEAQRHTFEEGGWYYVEVIPNKLAVFSLNTMYFFGHNTAVDGCALKSEPGYEHMEWLRIQLEFMRQRGLKVILMGHVPPAHTENKALWDETCWQKYTLWLRQYRDIIIGGIYGHMNIDHFILQDTEEIDIAGLSGATQSVRAQMEDELAIMAASDYLEELRTDWSKLPNPKPAFSAAQDDYMSSQQKKKHGKKSKKPKNPHKVIGGPWAERFQVTNIGPSVIPNYFPTLRVVEYNISGLDRSVVWHASPAAGTDLENLAAMEERLEDIAKFESADLDDVYADEGDWNDDNYEEEEDREGRGDVVEEDLNQSVAKKPKKNKGKKHKKPHKPKDPNLNIPLPPSSTTPPGPAYSPQTLTFLGYTQYFANLTHINNDAENLQSLEASAKEVDDEDIEPEGWHPGKHKGKKPKKDKPEPKKFSYEIEYSTFNDSGFKLEDMTVKSYLKLAHRIGRYDENIAAFDEEDGTDDDQPDELDDEETALSLSQKLLSAFENMVLGVEEVFSSVGKLCNLANPSKSLDIFSQNSATDTDDVDPTKKRRKHSKKHNKKKHHKSNHNKVWLVFIKRAFIGIMDDDDLKKFQATRNTLDAAKHTLTGQGAPQNEVEDEL
jgi:endopolyphosphatase